MKYQFMCHDKVRDYECDIQGIVNNSVYHNYLEHARHEFLLKQGVDFVRLAREGVNLVVLRSEVDYKQSLLPGDRYWVGVTLQKQSKLKFAFLQAIYREGDDKPAILAKVIGVAVNQRGRPCVVDDLERLLYPLTC